MIARSKHNKRIARLQLSIEGQLLIRASLFAPEMRPWNEPRSTVFTRCLLAGHKETYASISPDSIVLVASQLVQLVMVDRVIAVQLLALGAWTDREEDCVAQLRFRDCSV
jgi:hypothetical protein